MRWWRSLVYTLCILLVTITCIAGCAPRLGYAPTPEPVTLRFAFREQTVELETLIGQFHEKYPWITVELLTSERFGDQLNALILAGNLDVFQDGREALQYVEQGLIAPLDDIQLGDWSNIRDDYISGAWEGLSIAGQQWGIPAGMDMLVAYVNMDQALALNVDVPDADWTLFEFVELATELNYPEGLPHAEGTRLWGFCSDPNGIDPIVFTYLHGGRVVDDINSPSEVLLDSPDTVEAIQWYSDLFNSYGVAPFPDVVRSTFRRFGVYEAAVRGSCGIWLGWYSGRGGLDTPFEWGMKWRMLPLPRDRESFGLGDVEGYFILKESEHPQEVLKLLRFLADHWEAAGSNMPPRRSLLTSKGYEEAVGEETMAVIERFPDRVLMLPAGESPALDQVGSVFLSSIELIIKEDLDAGQVLEEGQRQVKDVFKQP
ncbi:MAG: extracellular solute-binding protein [Anaerolineae bacterium]|nr:extracellular solute-binding protein [Anaerolineae bacterium]